MGPLFLIVFFLHGAWTQGPVYVNPAGGSPAVQSTSQAAPEALVTQTVYGFLDFTTTIGNTVMIFSPQSAGADKPPAASTTTSKAPVIETRPPASTSASAPSTLDIKPSKTAVGKPSSDKKASSAQTVIFSSVVEVRKPAAGVPSSKVFVVAGPASSEVHIQSKAPSSVVHVVKAPSSKVEVLRGPVASASVKPKVAPSTVVEVRGGASSVVFSSVVEVLASSSNNDEEEPALLLGDNALEPEYDFLSRQPSEVVDETYKVINLKPSSKFHLKPRQSTAVGHKASSKHLASSSQRPAGGAKVRPTPASSAARILKTAAPRPRPQQAPVLEPTPVAGTLADETAALPLEALFSSAPGLTRNQRRPAVSGSRNNNRQHLHKQSSKHDQDEEDVTVQEVAPSHGKHGKKHHTSRQQQQAASTSIRATSTYRPGFRASKNAGGNGRFSRPEVATVSVFHETATATVTPSRRTKDSGASGSPGRRFRPNNNNQQVVATAVSEQQSTRRNSGGSGYKARIQASSAVEPATASTSVYKFKLNRPSGRWQYKTTPKPRVTIRRGQADVDDADNSVAPPQPQATTPQAPQQTTPAPPQQQVAAEQQALSRVDTDADQDLEVSQSQNSEPEQQQLLPEDKPAIAAAATPELDSQTPVAETIKVEISTPADFKDVYYEIATIKSPYTFQVGTVRNTRYITVTSTIERSLEPTRTEAPGSGSTAAPAPENILSLEASLPALEAGLATLPVLTLSPGTETPPLQTTTETFSTTTMFLKTHVLPVVAPAGNTTRYTLVQSYEVTRQVTATRTLPPTQLYQFEASRALTDFSSHLEEAGSELHLELDLADNHHHGDSTGRDDHARPKKAPTPALLLDAANNNNAQQQLQQLSVTPPPPQLSPEQLQQLALLRFLNPGAAAALPQVVTTSRPVLRLETVYDSHVVPVFDGQSTTYSTIRRPVATVSRTEFEFGTTTVAPQPQPLNPLAQLNPLNPLQQPQFAVTSTPIVTQTLVTETDSKILKLTFGAKTAYTTLTSTRVVPTLLTTYLTASVPVQATAPPAAAFPGFFPSPYGQFPFVG